MNTGFSSTRESTVAQTGERVLIDEEGNKVIPASRRPDGSLRKEIKIRKGYVPTEETPIYQSRGASFRQLVQAHQLAAQQAQALETQKTKKAVRNKTSVTATPVPQYKFAEFTGVKSQPQPTAPEPRHQK